MNGQLAHAKCVWHQRPQRTRTESILHDLRTNDRGSTASIGVHGMMSLISEIGALLVTYPDEAASRCGRSRPRWTDTTIR
jgi:hypothetical protein